MTARTITLGDWQTLIQTNDPRRRVKGWEVARQFTSDYRFSINETNTWDGQFIGTTYRVCDAHTVSDAEVREGVAPRVVFTGDYDAAIAFMNGEYAKETI